MIRLFDILTYAVLLACEFYTLCAMTRGGRGWVPRILGLLALAAVDVATEGVWDSLAVPPDLWLAAQFTACWLVLSGFTLWLSRDRPGRRVFLALCYGMYAVGYASCFDVIVYRPFAACGREALSTPPVHVVAVGLAAVVLLSFAFVRWVLPRLPRGGRDFRWRDSCLVVGMMFAAMFASSLWPVSVVSAPAVYCVPFVLVSVAAWFVFPMACGRMRDRQRTAEITHSLELMMAEMKERRAAIDLARRLRHDQRHHRAQIAEYLLAGRYDRVFDYLKALDEESQEAPTDKLVWCESETVNAVLSGASRHAAARGVALAAEVHLERALPFPDVQLVAVLANLIENAIEAAASVPPAPDSDALPVVRVRLRQREHGLGITVVNPVPDGFALSDRGLPCAEPGVGLESVRRVVERHGGQWSYELNGGELRCQVILMSAPDALS